MPFSRKFLHYSPNPQTYIGEISSRAVAGCWFELHRRGGCGAGELILYDEFSDRTAIDIGDWIAFEYDTGDRWYFGRVERRQAKSPAGVSFSLQGPGIELSEVFPGGFGRAIADGVPPHRYSRTDIFFNDPDYSSETVDSVDEPYDLVLLLLQQYVNQKTNISYDSSDIEPTTDALITSFKFRGEESVQSVVQQAAFLAGNASWGVDADGKFFFQNQNSTIIATYQEGIDLQTLEENRDRDLLFNRVVLTGGYVYEDPDVSAAGRHGFFLWKGNYIQPESRTKYGERRIRVSVPWVRSQGDSRTFITEFFKVYAEPTNRYLIDVGNQSVLPKPWEGQIQILSADGNELIRSQVETIRVQFDHAPKFFLKVGPDDPRIHWPEPIQEDRGVIPSQPVAGFGGELITLVDACGPSSSISDTFTDLDGVRLENHTMDAGCGWTEVGGTWTIQSNTAETSDSEPICYTESNLSDVTVTASAYVGSATGLHNVSLLLRVVDENNYWQLATVEEDNRLKIWEITNGSSILRSYVPKTINPSTTYALSATASGTTISSTVESTTVSYSNATAHQTATKVGIKTLQTGTVTELNHFNNFAAAP